MEVLRISIMYTYIAGALMEHFLEGSPPIRLWYVNKDEKFGVFVWLLIWVNVPMS